MQFMSDPKAPQQQYFHPVQSSNSEAKEPTEIQKEFNVCNTECDENKKQKKYEV